VSVEVRTLVVPEGGELPSEEELEAMEAAERGTPEPEPAHEGPSLEEIAAPEPDREPEPAADAEPQPDWRADAEAALAEE
jgi:hypothetical protein